MIGWIALAAFTGTTVVCGTPAREPVFPPAGVHGSQDRAPGAHAATLRELYEAGTPFDAFLEAASARRALWMRNWDGATVPADLLDRALAVPGTWRVLAVAVDGCSDSVNTIPYVAKLAELVPALDLRIIDSTVGREIMESHRTPDGRAATPTLLLLDSEFTETGCFIERPTPLQQWYAERQGTMAVRELTERKMEWYAEDAGRATLDEIVAMIESAAAGSPICAANAADSAG